MLGRRAEKRTLVERCTWSRGARVKRCALSNGARGLRGTRGQERTLHERHVLARHERSEADELWVGATGKSRLLSCFLFIWVYVQILVGGACGGYSRIV